VVSPVKHCRSPGSLRPAGCHYRSLRRWRPFQAGFFAENHPFAELWGVMHFPDDEGKRRAYVARLWSGFYPKYEKTGLGEPVPRSVLLSIMEGVASAPVERAEIADRHLKGLAAGDQLRVLFAIAQTEAKRASWNAATRLVEHRTGKRRAYLYEVRRAFLPVIHFWTAYILRDRYFHADRSPHYSAIDDVQIFIAEAMAILQWGTGFKLARDKAGPTLNREKVDFWIPRPDWSAPVARPEWPRDGRLQAVSLEPAWMRRTGMPLPRKKPV
jgi:hypothetical protein